MILDQIANGLKSHGVSAIVGLQMARGARRRLIREGRESGDPDTARRFLIVAKLAAGHRQAEVARALEVVPSVVSRAASAFIDDGEERLHDARAANGSRKVDTEFAEAVAE